MASSILLWIYPPLLLLLTTVAIYQYVRSTQLSLPVSSAAGILTILLPFLASINAAFFPRLWKSDASYRILAVSLQAAQGILITVVATLAFSDILPSTARECLLSTTWQLLFSAHDANAIRNIQDSLQCCGFRTVKDRPWPFPDNHSSNQCVKTYGRSVACIEPWQQVLQQNSGLEFGVVLAVGVIQAVTLFTMLTGSRTAIFGARPWNSWSHRETHEPRLLPASRENAYQDDPDPSEDDNVETEIHTNGHGHVEDSAARSSSHGNPWNAA
ncbi:hypothetical protein B0I35DRAFT_483042 [Stachybotrys elegans]|uniref:Tetraspanin Tsp3 n=1 Tax=Stachybotrys elegans TaxID=80388 RepID=A0A8K0SL07_9HYPO|nr:hypothetical protein B0I35DRAFT_483042 [Stachybotrys elegans]